MGNHNTKRASVVSLTIFFLILLSTGLSGYYIWQGVLHGFDKYLPILCSTLLLDGLGIFALVFKVSFETRRRAIVPFVASILLIVVCSIHLAALANMRTGAISQDESDARTKSLDDDRHARNVGDANALVQQTCAQCSPERKQRLYQAEMARLENGKAQVALINQSPQTPGVRSWGRQYIENYATAVQLIFGLLCGIGMLVNNFLRLHAKDAETPAPHSGSAPIDDGFPRELEVTEKRSPIKRAEFVTTPAKTTTHVSLKNDDTSAYKETTHVSLKDTSEGLRKLRECLKLISFHNPGIHFKADLKDDCVWIRAMASDHGVQRTAHSARAQLSILDDVLTTEPGAFRARLERFMKQRGFEL